MPFPLAETRSVVDLGRVKAARRWTARIRNKDIHAPKSLLGGRHQVGDIDFARDVGRYRQDRSAGCGFDGLRGGGENVCVSRGEYELGALGERLFADRGFRRSR